jgi:hypothetical protein
MTLQVEVERIDIAEPENSGNMAVCVGWGGGGYSYLVLPPSCKE